MSTNNSEEFKPTIRELTRENIQSYENVETLPANQPKSEKLLNYYPDAEKAANRNAQYRKKVSSEVRQEIAEKYIKGTLWYNEETKQQELYYPTYNDLSKEYGVSKATLQSYGRQGMWGLHRKAVKIHMSKVKTEEDLKGLFVNIKAMESEKLRVTSKLQDKLEDLVDSIDTNDEDMKSTSMILKNAMDTLLKIDQLQESIIKKDQLNEDIQTQFKILAEEKQKLIEARKKKRVPTLIRQGLQKNITEDSEIIYDAKQELIKLLEQDNKDLDIRL